VPKGISINIGLNSVDATHYQGWAGLLQACEADAKDMNAIAKANHFDARLLLTQDATSKNVIDALNDAASKLASGDILLLTYSGHGGQVPDTNHDEPDNKDETWVLYDRQLVDDELWAIWGKFAAGVRIYMLSDSCHSGSVNKAFYDAAKTSDDVKRLYANQVPSEVRGMPDDVGNVVYKANKETYDSIQMTSPAGDTVNVKASVLLISGCQDNQLSSDGDKNGLFTATLLKVWNNGAFKGSYRRFHTVIAKRMPPYQSPNLNIVGLQNPKFIAETPFSVGAAQPVKV
jgi:hypothetical protein